MYAHPEAVSSLLRPFKNPPGVGLCGVPAVTQGEKKETSSKSEKRLKTKARPWKVTEKWLGQGSEEEVPCFEGKVLVDIREFFTDKEGGVKPERKKVQLPSLDGDWGCASHSTLA
ncbi:uncharacterized protein ACIQIH_017695 [Cyanocitta cristata]